MTFKLTLAASVAAIAMLGATSAFAAVGEINTPANVRDGAGTHYDIIGYLHEGATVECVDFEHGWCVLDDDEGYIANSLIDFDGYDDDEDDDDDYGHGYDYDDVDVKVKFHFGY